MKPVMPVKPVNQWNSFDGLNRNVNGDDEEFVDIDTLSGVTMITSHPQISQLVEDVQRLQTSVKQLRDSTSTQVAKLEEELSEKNRTVKLLEERLKNQEDYQEVKRELG